MEKKEGDLRGSYKGFCMSNDSEIGKQIVPVER